MINNFSVAFFFYFPILFNLKLQTFAVICRSKFVPGVPVSANVLQTRYIHLIASISYIAGFRTLSNQSTTHKKISVSDKFEDFKKLRNDDAIDSTIDCYFL